jgi:hypothetical protein
MQAKQLKTVLLLTVLGWGLSPLAQAQTNIDGFFEANRGLADYGTRPNLNDYAKRRVGEPSYLLVDWDDYDGVKKRYLAERYVELGVSTWMYAGTGGIPEKESAIEYARKLGAERVLYSAKGWTDNYGRYCSTHYVGFYARPLQNAAAVTPTPTTAPTETQTRPATSIDFLLGIDSLLTVHDYPTLSRYLGDETSYFGKTNATKAWISNDMTNDQRTYEWCKTVPNRSTYHDWVDANGYLHQSIDEETWSQERAGRPHHAHCRFEIVLSGQTILEFHLTVLRHG